LVIALLFALGKSVLFLYAYLLWVGATRLIDALLLLTARPAISGLYPPLIYLGQIYGALIEAYRLSRLGRQSWPLRPRSISPFLPWRAHLQALRPAWSSDRRRGVRRLVAAPASAVVRNAHEAPDRP
jgi:hypothetical protein